MDCASVVSQLLSTFRLKAGLVIIVAAYPAICIGQSRAPILPGGADSGVVIPTASGKTRTMDVSALAEIRASVAALNAGAWKTMQATGTITYADDHSQALPITFASATGLRFRLDTQTSIGTESTRIVGKAGEYQSPDHKIKALDPDTALASAFLFQVAVTAQEPKLHPIVTDRGSCQVSGVQLHRITVELPATGIDSSTRSRRTLPIDFYFDPTTHLLVKSVTYAPPVGTTARFVTVVTYSDYRKVESALLPFQFTETIDGQLSRTIQLSSIQLNPAFDPAYFKF